LPGKGKFWAMVALAAVQGVTAVLAHFANPDDTPVESSENEAKRLVKQLYSINIEHADGEADRLDSRSRRTPAM
jgi:hypothetical protein